MPKSKFADRKKPKQKSIKSHAKLSSKRKLSRFGKVQKKGHAGTATSYVTRTRAIKKLQLTIKDFRRLCILKGIYPRDPKKKTKGSGNTYYHIKDIQYLSHEPLLAKFRETKAFMKKVKKAVGRGEIAEARRLYSAKPSFTLDHLVKERYPRFGDALADMDDALCMVHLFAALPADRMIDTEQVVTSARLVKEWQSYVVKAKALRKVFLSIKGVYFEAEIGGQSIVWLQPWQFAQTMPRGVDFKVMGTFLQFHALLLKFVMFKLYHGLGLTYPPVLDEGVLASGGHLSAVRLQPVNAGTPAESGTITQRGADAAQLKALPAILSAVTSSSRAVGDEEDGEEEEEEEEEDEEPTPLDKEEAAVAAAARQRRVQQKLFKGLTFFLSREVPRELFEFVCSAFGGRVGWDGPGSPFDSTSSRITHHVIDRSVPTGGILPGREYVQPQWIIDSANSVFVLPVSKYGPGCTLPPHLSPFVDDTAKGYMPQYREQLDQLIAAASGNNARKAPQLEDGNDESESEEGSEEEEEEEEEDSEDEESSEEEAPARGIPQAASAAIVKKRKATEMEIQDEQRKLAESMLSNKKAKQYKVVMRSKARKEAHVEKMHARRAAVEAVSAPQGKKDTPARSIKKSKAA